MVSEPEAERLSAVVLNSLDQEAATNDLAHQAYRSRSQFYRVFRALIDETPAGMRRRLFLERAAWQLGRTRRLLKHAAALSDEQLDRPQKAKQTVFGWDKPDSNLRETLARMVETKEVWVAALSGGDMPHLGGPPSERTPAAMLRRFEKAEADFQRILGDVRARNAWSDTFVDALCEPAETFTFGGMFADVVTFNAVRRLAALDAFQRLGVPIAGSGSPIEYEASIAGCTD